MAKYVGDVTKINVGDVLRLEFTIRYDLGHPMYFKHKEVRYAVTKVHATIPGWVDLTYSQPPPKNWCAMEPCFNITQHLAAKRIVLAWRRSILNPEYALCTA